MNQSNHPAALVDVRLYGHLRARFGRGYPYAVRTPAEAIRALCCTVPGFRQYLRENSEPGYRIVVDKTPIAAEAELHHAGRRTSIKIVPVVAGSAGSGKILGGALLIGLSFVPGLQAISPIGSTTLSSVAFNLGVSMALGGIAQAIAGTPKAPTPASIERPENQPSYAFDGPVNVTAQGQAIPLVYGRMRVGSVVISSGLSVSQLPA